MSIGKRKIGCEILPHLKYDARSGRFFTIDRVLDCGQWVKEQNDVTSEFEALFDLQRLQVGWINFPKGAAPEMILVPAGQDYGAAPDDEGFKEGFRVIVQVGDTFREFMSTAAAAWAGMDALHDEFTVECVNHPEMLPVAKLIKVVPQKIGQGTNFSPVFRIVAWRRRPDDMPGPSASTAVVERPAKPSLQDDMSDDIPF
jgi:hypothetical protein